MSLEKIIEDKMLKRMSVEVILQQTKAYGPVIQLKGNICP